MAPLADVLSLLRLWRLLGRLKPDVVEFSTPKAGLLGTLAAKLRGVPRRVYLLRGLKLESTRGCKRRILLAAERLASRCAHVVLCNSESLRTRALELRVAPPAKLHLLGDGSSNGVDVERFSPGPCAVRERLGFSPVAPELIDAFDTVLAAEPQAQLLLVGWFDAGEDALDGRLRAHIESHPCIHCTGLVDDTAPYYRAMDVLVLPTWREGFPNVVLEAAATGVPAITTVTTGSRDAVVAEVTGLLIPPGYPEAIAEALLKLLHDPERRRRMGQAARARVIEHYSEQRVLGLTTAYYRSLLEPAVSQTESR
jgi:glycosyltransferase involved in cell wall biosynthesis